VAWTWGSHKLSRKVTTWFVERFCNAILGSCFIKIKFHHQEQAPNNTLHFFISLGWGCFHSKCCSRQWIQMNTRFQFIHLFYSINWFKVNSTLLVIPSCQHIKYIKPQPRKLKLNIVPFVLFPLYVIAFCQMTESRLHSVLTNDPTYTSLDYQKHLSLWLGLHACNSFR
jgi:hypothetical protein